jgi:DNA-binding SARP family transcriptional activator/TolB-like protein
MQGFRPSTLDSSQATVEYRLRVLGRLALEDGLGVPEGAASRPRSLALLAILAAAGEAGVPRDKLLLYLWPESNTRRARNSLHQTLYAIRRHLGEEAVQVGTLNLQLNPACFTSDLWEFLAALDRGSVEEAIALYDGPFLEGFALPELPEFDHWLEEQRARIALRYADALEASAAQASQLGHHRLAVERWQALARLDPLSSRPALGLMRAYAAAGNRASALEHARDYEARIQRELGTVPDPAITVLAEQLRSVRDSGQTAATVPQMVIPSSLPGAEQLAEVEPAPAPHRRRAIPLRVWKLAVLVMTLVDIAAVGTLWWTRRGPPDPPTTSDLVAVFPFTVEGSPEVQYLGTGLVDLLSSKLEGAGEIRSVDPHALLGWLARRDAPVRTPAEARKAAARFGAGRYLLGSVVESGDRLHLRVAMYDRERGEEPVALAAVQGEASDLFSLVDQLTTQLLAQVRER